MLRSSGCAHPKLSEGADSLEAAVFKPNTNQSQQFGSSGRHTGAEHTRAPRGGRLPRSRGVQA